jgi:hypothetical protein
MKRKKGPVETFSVSVDAVTKRILKAHAERVYEGNMSAMISVLRDYGSNSAAIAANVRTRLAPVPSSLRVAPAKRPTSG